MARYGLAMRVHLDYGRDGIDVDLPEANVVKVLGYTERPPLADPSAAILAALAQPRQSPPLVDLARRARSACIVICDVTRPVPNRVILPPLLSALEEGGIPRDRVTILVATGLHRATSPAELEEMLGPDIVRNWRVENHDGRDRSQHTFLGTSPRGVPALIDSRYVEAQLKITTGLVEPHFMAGFSGGRKLICPGIAGQETIETWHSPRFLEHPAARAGSLQDNPVHEENTWIARRAGCDFIVNVVLDAKRQIVAVEAGDMEAAFLAAAKTAGQMATDTVPAPVDMVVTTGAGYPLDATYYQCIKGMVAANEIVRPGGTIILAGGIAEGIGSAEFQSLYREHATLDAFMDRLLSGQLRVADQWQLEEFAKARRKAEIVVVSQGLPADVLETLYVRSAPSVEAAVAEGLAKYGPSATIAVIPKGPYVIAAVADAGSR